MKLTSPKNTCTLFSLGQLNKNDEIWRQLVSPYTLPQVYEYAHGVLKLNNDKTLHAAFFHDAFPPHSVSIFNYSSWDEPPYKTMAFSSNNGFLFWFIALQYRHVTFFLNHAEIALPICYIHVFQLAHIVSVHFCLFLQCKLVYERFKRECC